MALIDTPQLYWKIHNFCPFFTKKNIDYSLIIISFCDILKLTEWGKSNWFIHYKLFFPFRQRIIDFLASDLLNTI